MEEWDEFCKDNRIADPGTGWLIAGAILAIVAGIVILALVL